MSRKATSWSYGPEVLGLKLTARDLAFLHAVCWSIHPKLKWQCVLGSLTGRAAHKSLGSVRQSLGLVWKKSRFTSGKVSVRFPSARG